MRSSERSCRLIVVSAGLTYPPPPMNWFADHLVFPLLRGVIGRTLYADMRAMEEYLQTVRDIDWTVVRPGRLIDTDAVSDYRLEPGNPTRGSTSRPDLAAAMVSLLTSNDYSRSVVAPTTERRGRKRCAKQTASEKPFECCASNCASSTTESRWPPGSIPATSIFSTSSTGTVRARPRICQSGPAITAPP